MSNHDTPNERHRTAEPFDKLIGMMQLLRATVELDAEVDCPEKLSSHVDYIAGRVKDLQGLIDELVAAKARRENRLQ